MDRGRVGALDPHVGKQGMLRVALRGDDHVLAVAAFRLAVVRVAGVLAVMGDRVLDEILPSTYVPPTFSHFPSARKLGCSQP